MEQEKLDWLAKINAVELRYPYKYYCANGSHIMYYSEEYVKETPLEELKRGFLDHYDARVILDNN